MILARPETPAASLAPAGGVIPWQYSARGIAVRLFLTCWLIYALHAATNIVREIYPAVSLGDRFSLRVDEYAGLHPDLFEKPGFGWHINSNPGASLVGAVPYALLRPVADRIVAQVNRQRASSPAAAAPVYNSPWPMAREFYQKAWERGLDVKLGLAALIMQTLAMAPVSAAGVLAMFFLLRRLLGSDRKAVWFALLYAFGTPIFFRTGYLNQNLLLAHCLLFGLLALWNPGNTARWPDSARHFAAGAAGGLGVLMDYTGVVPLLGLSAYAVFANWQRGSFRRVLRLGGWFVTGALGPLALLWFAQWRSFGHPFYPAQHWMAPVEWVEVGYRGFGWPQWDMLAANLFDYRYGLFVSCPLLLLAFLSLWPRGGFRRVLPARELAFLFGTAGLLWLFCASVSYSRLQFNTGVRYMIPAVPLLFLPLAVVLDRLPKRVVCFAAILAVAQAWPMAMYRDVERGLGVLDPVLHVFLGGFQLPVLSTLSRIGGPYGDYVANGVSPLPLFVMVAFILYGIWSKRPGTPAGEVRK